MFPIAPNGYRGTIQQKGLTMVPKRAVNVMAGEIDRLLVLTQNAIIPVGFHVQRRVSKTCAEDQEYNYNGDKLLGMIFG